MKRIITLALLLPTPLLAQQDANSTSYNYFDGSYYGVNWDVPAAPDLDGSGFMGRFSIEVRPHLFMTGSYTAWDFDTVAGSSKTTSLGIGSNWDLGRRWSIFGVAGFRTIDLDIGAGNMEDESGYLSGGARLQLGRGFEARVSADYQDLSPAAETSVTIGGDIYLTEAIALAIDLNQADDDTTSIVVGIRFYHDKDSSSLRQRR